MKKSSAVTAVLVFVASTSGAVAADKSAMQQLKDAASGNQSTGKTFDGSIRPLPTDAYPKGNHTVPSVNRSTSTPVGVDKSSSTAPTKPNRDPVAPKEPPSPKMK